MANMSFPPDAALLQYSQINTLPEADPINVKSLRTWIEDPQLGKRQISGSGSATWGKLLSDPDSQPPPLTQEFFDVLRSAFQSNKTEKDDLDLVVPCRVDKLDGFTRWIATKFVPLWQHYKDRKKPLWKILWMEFRSRKEVKEVDAEKYHPSAESEKKDKRGPSIKQIILHPFQRNKPKESQAVKSVPTIQTYSENNIRRFTSHVATIIACLLPIVAIGVLSTMHRTPEIIGFITLFVAIFAIGLMCVADAGTKRTDIFTATAA
jgi:hypothetical protein